MFVAIASGSRSAETINQGVDVGDGAGEDAQEELLMNALAASLDTIDYNPDEMSYEELVRFWQTRLL
jgi:hypothetical protein